MTDTEHTGLPQMSELQQKTFIQPRKLANKNGELRYNWKVENFKRLDGLLFSNNGDINIHLRGKYDDRQRCLIDAHITANVQLECQTSFEAIDYQIDKAITYCTVISEDQIDDLEDEYEALLLDEGHVDIQQVIEDELILALPIIANKASDEVRVEMSYGELPPEDENKKNPFTVLKGLDIKK